MAKKTVTKSQSTKKPTKTVKAAKKPVKKSVRATKVTSGKKNFLTPKERAVMLKKIRFGESYTSLALGIVAVIIGTLLLLSVFNGRQATRQTPEATPTTVAKSDEFKISPTGVKIEEAKGVASPALQPTTKPTVIKAGGKTYTVVAGDDLWSISEKVYGSGYNWVDLAQANNLSDPSDIHVGNVLKVPEVSLKDATVHTMDDDQSSTTAKITSGTYVIMKGDDLWDIAVRAYGDGYKWVEIAKANDLSNPDIIHVGNTLKLPRN
jgi:nucleoid-associated protein YgaU